MYCGCRITKVCQSQGEEVVQSCSVCSEGDGDDHGTDPAAQEVGMNGTTSVKERPSRFQNIRGSSEHDAQ